MTKKDQHQSFDSFDEHKKVDMAIQTAKLYYIEKNPKNRIAQKLDLRDSRVVNDFLDYARSQGIVNITIGEASGIHIQPKKDPRLADTLIASFPHLERAIVMDASFYDELYDIEKDNRIHEMLGKVMAQELQTILRSKDHIGVTGGRATSACARSMELLSQDRAFNQRDVVVTALAGGISRSPEIPPFEVLSADNVAITMTAALKDATHHLLSVPWIALHNKATYLKYPTERFIQEDEWENNSDRIPTIAILGIGIIQEKTHPFFYENKLELEPIRDSLVALQEHVKAVGYHAVGDLGQRFFIIDPPEGFKIDSDRFEELERLTREINDHVVAPTLAQLRKINSVIAIAGGEHKRNAIWTVLTKHDVWAVRGLCTDSATAEWLIKRKRKTLDE